MAFYILLSGTKGKKYKLEKLKTYVSKYLRNMNQNTYLNIYLKIPCKSGYDTRK